MTPEELNAMGHEHFPGLVGVRIVTIGEGAVTAEMPVRSDLLAPNNFLHAGAVVTLADTTCGYGCIASLPTGAQSFTTIELKSNFLGTVRDGVLRCEARAAHLGRTTQVWDAAVIAAATGKTIALFRCTQMILWPKAE